MVNDVEISGKGKLLECQECGKYFVAYPHLYPVDWEGDPKCCPTCTDVRQLRPSVVVSRQEMVVYDGVTIESLPFSYGWEERQQDGGDYPTYRMRVLGKAFGANWSGRIDLFATQPFEKSSVIMLREMVSEHRVKKVTESRHHIQRDIHDSGTHSVTYTVPLQSDEGEEVIETRKYLVLEPTDTPASGMKLVWVEAHTKTTLKGLGRQYYAQISGSPIASWSVYGGYRSGRANIHGMLAIVDVEHPVIITGTGDVQFREEYH